MELVLVKFFLKVRYPMKTVDGRTLSKYMDVEIKDWIIYSNNPAMFIAKMRGGAAYVIGKQKQLCPH